MFKITQLKKTTLRQVSLRLALAAVALLAPLGLRAQETLTVYDETTGTLTTNSNVPMYGNYFDAYVKSEFVIPADQLSDMDGGTITSLKFYIQSVGTYGSGWSSNQQVFLKEVSSTSLSAFSGTDDATIVWEGSFTVPSSSDSEFEITFTTPYEYQGGNLLVGIYNITRGGYRNVAWYGQTVSGASGNGQNSSSLSSVSFSQKNFIPKTTFTYVVVTDTPKPRNLQKSDITGHNATLTWEAPNDATPESYFYSVKRELDADWPTEDVTTSTSVTYNTLDPVTNYEFRVRANYGATGQSDYIFTSFTTDVACPAPTDLAVAEGDITATGATATWYGTSSSYEVSYGAYDYTATPILISVEEDLEGGSMPEGWTHIGNGSAAYYVGSAHSTSHSIRFSNATSNNVLVLPEFDAEINTMTISYWSKPESAGSSGEFDMGYVTDPADVSTFQAIHTNVASVDGNSYTEVSNISLASAPAGARLAFRHRSGSSSWYWFLDDITLNGVAYPIAWNAPETTTNTSYTFEGLTPNSLYFVKVKGNCGDEGYSAETEPVSFTTIASCEAPNALHATEDQTNQSVLSWTARNGETAWTIYYKKTTEENYNEVTNVTDNPYTLEDLDASTPYQFYVVANCSATETSAPSDVYSFRTACGAITTFPWRENFESYASGNFSDPCWVNEHITGDGTQIFKINTSTNGGNSTHQLQLPDQSSGTMTKLVLPEMTLPNANYQFTIDVYRSNSTYSVSDNPYEGIRVFASTDGEIEGATELAFIPRQYNEANGSIPAEAAAGWYTYELPIGMSGNCYIILRGENRYCTATYMDNFVVEPVPTCIKPTNFAKSNVTNHSATLSWEAGNEGQEAWQIAYSTTSFDPNVANFDLTSVNLIENVTENSYLFDKTLDAATTYYMFVRGDCGNDDYSKWAGLNLTTAVAAPAPTITTVDEIMPDHATLHWTAPAGDFLESYDIYYSQTSGTPGTEVTPQYTGVSKDDVSKLIENFDAAGTWYVFIRAYHGETDGYSSWSPSYGKSFTVPEACPVPTDLTASNPSPSTIDVSWTRGASWQTSWRLAYSTTDADFNPEEADYVDVPEQEGNTITVTVENLENTTTYYFKVRGNCGDNYGTSAWTTNDVHEATQCPVPSNIDVDVVTNNVTLSWDGNNDSYTVQYREAGHYDIEQGFENGLGDWTFISMNTVNDIGGGSSSYHAGIVDVAAHEGSNGFRMSSYTTKEPSGEYDQYLISPELSNVDNLSFYAWRYGTGDDLYVGTSTTTNDIDAFTWSDALTFDASKTWQQFSQELPADVKYVAFHYYGDYKFYVYIDEIITGEYHNPGEWIEETVTDKSLALTLDYSTKYDVQVNGTCGSNVTDWSDMFTFTTDAPFSLNIVAGNWYAISSPVNNPVVTDVENLVATGEEKYDFFRYDEASATWQNYKTHNTSDFSNFENGVGYIYRRSANAKLSFPGVVNDDESYPVTLTNSLLTAGELAGFNLVGNPFMHTYDLDLLCYTLGTNGVWIVHNDGVTLNIAQAVLVYSEYGEDYTFGEAIAKKGGYAAPAITLTVAGNGFEDVAYARLADGKGMPKVSHLNEAAPMLSIPVESRRYAIASLGYDCQSFPVAFRGQKGQYTLTVNAELANVSYCHLIDRATGRDIDMLQEKSYTFTATGNDADRFEVKLSPEAIESVNGHFVYWNGSVWMVEGNGTLEAYDVTGRMLFSSEVNDQLSVSNSQFPSTGVYVLRMGNKSQKIVIR